MSEKIKRKKKDVYKKRRAKIAIQRNTDKEWLTQINEIKKNNNALRLKLEQLNTQLEGVEIKRTVEIKGQFKINFI